MKGNIKELEQQAAKAAELANTGSVPQANLLASLLKKLRNLFATEERELVREEEKKRKLNVERSIEEATKKTEEEQAILDAQRRAEPLAATSSSTEDSFSERAIALAKQAQQYGSEGLKALGKGLNTSAKWAYSKAKTGIKLTAGALVAAAKALSQQISKIWNQLTKPGKKPSALSQPAKMANPSATADQAITSPSVTTSAAATATATKTTAPTSLPPPPAPPGTHPALSAAEGTQAIERSAELLGRSPKEAYAQFSATVSHLAKLTGVSPAIAARTVYNTLMNMRPSSTSPAPTPSAQNAQSSATTTPVELRTDAYSHNTSPLSPATAPGGKEAEARTAEATVASTTATPRLSAQAGMSTSNTAANTPSTPTLS